MGGIGAIATTLFAIFWTLTAASIGAPIFFTLSGVVFILVGIVSAIYNFKNATGANRFSIYDITDHSNEPDPFGSRFDNITGSNTANRNHADSTSGNFCPYCGSKMESDHLFCKKCGKRVS